MYVTNNTPSFFFYFIFILGGGGDIYIVCYFPEVKSKSAGETFLKLNHIAALKNNNNNNSN